MASLFLNFSLRVFTEENVKECVKKFLTSYVEITVELSFRFSRVN